jgi:ankyrin repeat protein
MALQAGADVNHKDKESSTALHYAAIEGHEALAQGAQLLGAGADINAAASTGWTPLHCTARCNKPEVAKVLLANGAQVNARNNAGYTAVELAQNAQTIDVLKGAGATMPEFPEEKKNDLLIENAEKGLAGGALMALQAGADVNHKNSYSMTALHYAAIEGLEALAQRCWAQGRTSRQQTRTRGQHSTGLPATGMKRLLGAGADINAADKLGQTALALARGKPEMEALLRQHGAKEDEGHDDEEDEEDDGGGMPWDPTNQGSPPC